MVIASAQTPSGIPFDDEATNSNLTTPPQSILHPNPGRYHRTHQQAHPWGTQAGDEPFPLSSPTINVNFSPLLLPLQATTTILPNLSLYIYIFPFILFSRWHDPSVLRFLDTGMFFPRTGIRKTKKMASHLRRRASRRIGRSVVRGW